MRTYGHPLLVVINYLEGISSPNCRQVGPGKKRKMPIMSSYLSSRNLVRASTCLGFGARDAKASCFGTTEQTHLVGELLQTSVSWSGVVTPLSSGADTSTGLKREAE